MVQLDPKRFDLLCRYISIGNIVLFIGRFLVKKVLEKKQELETSDSKAKSFSEFLYRYCKMERDQSYTNSMKVVYGYLHKRMTCKGGEWVVRGRKDVSKHVFHIVTNTLNYVAMKMWFLVNPPSKATIQVQHIVQRSCVAHSLGTSKEDS
ncbi:hypothetical protein JHK85_025173 [Glycine max]|nr:hypothetical protein JHK85_025173 [Glycine max]